MSLCRTGVLVFALLPLSAALADIPPAPMAPSREATELREKQMLETRTGKEGVTALQTQFSRFLTVGHDINVSCGRDTRCMMAYFRAYDTKNPTTRPGGLTVWETPVHLRYQTGGGGWRVEYEGLERAACQILMDILPPAHTRKASNRDCHEGTGRLSVPIDTD